MQNVTTKVRRNQGWLQLLGKRRKRDAVEWPCDRFFETYGRLGGEGTKLLRDLATASANGQCGTHAVGRWRTQLERVLLTAQADTYLRAPGSRVAERPAAELPLPWAEWRVCTVSVCSEVFAVRLSCEGSSDRDRDRDRD